MNIILIIIAIELGIRLLPILDSLVELVNHFIAIGIQKCDSIIRKIAFESSEEETKQSSNALPRIGFCVEDTQPLEEEDDLEND